jgi:hypothetical protein
MNTINITINNFSNITENIYSQTLLCYYQKTIFNCVSNCKNVKTQYANNCKLQCLINEKNYINSIEIELCNTKSQDCNNFKNLVNNLNNCDMNDNFYIVNTCFNNILKCPKYQINTPQSTNNDYIFGIIIGITFFFCICSYTKCFTRWSNNNIK